MIFLKTRVECSWLMFGFVQAGLLLAMGISCATATAQDGGANDEKSSQKKSQDSIWQAARDGNLEAIKAELESGVDVDAKTEYGATALFFACDRGHEDVVKFLLEQGADPNARDTFYKATPMTWAQSGDQKIVLLLLANGGDGADAIFTKAIASGDADYAKGVLETGKVSKEVLVKARDSVLREPAGDQEKQAAFMAIFNDLDLPEPVELPKLTAEMLKRYEGRFKSGRMFVEVEVVDGELKMGFSGGKKTSLVHVGKNEFTIRGTEIRFEVEQNAATSVTLGSGESKNKLARDTGTPDAEEAQPKIADAETSKPSLPSAGNAGLNSDSLRADRSVASPNWPGFRGNGARGIAEGQNPPTRWHVEGQNGEKPNEKLKWKTPVAGLGLSCPTIWGDYVYLTSAVSDGENEGLKIGLYGDVDSVDDDREYEFKLLCYSKLSGDLVWERTANKAKPAVKRHAKSSYANPTVATDGDHVVAFFGTEGLFCYSSNGDLIWKKDLGFLDSGWFYDPGYQWGFGSSPLIYNDRVVVQCDIQGQSFIAAFDLKTGKEIWRTDRDEIPTWSTPTVHEFGETAMLITNGTKSARGYDVADGKLLWSLKGHSEIVVPTPFVAHDLIFLASGYSPIQPIYAIKPEARGDISLEDNTLTNASIPWSVKRGGPYMPSPIVYGDYLYCCANNGILTCYVAKTGEQVYKNRVKASGGGLSFTASPIAADGHLYLTAEDGRVIVVKAGSEYEIVSVNECGESILATPAVSEGTIFFRTQDSLMAIGSED